MPSNWIVDASVARAAGESAVPVSKCSRNFLQCLYEREAAAFQFPELVAEWDKHQSGYFRKWRVAMWDRGGLIPVSVNSADVDADIAAASLDVHLTAIAHKDRHLVAGALVGPAHICSGDDAARRVYGTVATKNAKIKALVWVNPVGDAARIPLLVDGGSALVSEKL